MDVISRAEVFLRDKRKNNLSKLVIYRRGVDSINDLNATQGDTRVDSDSGDVLVRSRVVDWIIEAADLVIASVPITPQRGDKIIVDGKTFEAMDLGDQRCFQWHGRDFKSYRIHTKQVS